MKTLNYKMTIAILIFNTSYFPELANVYDSLGEVYLAVGDSKASKDAIEKHWN